MDQLVHKRLGGRSVERGKLDTAGLERGCGCQQDSGGRPARCWSRFGVVAPAWRVRGPGGAAQGAAAARLAGYPELPILEERVSARFLRDARALPVREDDDELALAMADPTDTFTIDAFAMVTGRAVRPMVAIPNDLDAALERLYGAGKSAQGQILGDLEQRVDEIAFDADVEHLRDLASEAPVIRLVNLVIPARVEERASDIHIEPFENRLKVRYRIDGVLHEVESPPASLTAAVISRVKIMAKLNIAERRLPQDGRIRCACRARNSTCACPPCRPCTANRWSCVSSTASRVVFDFDSLGFTDGSLPSASCKVLEQPQRHPAGHRPDRLGQDHHAVHRAFDSLNTPDVKIITVEDPVEYQLDGINQIQVKPQIGLNFRQRAALDRAAGSRRHHDRRNARPRNRADRDPVGADRPSRAVHAAHQRRRRRHHPPARHGRRGLPADVDVNGILAQRLVRRCASHCKEPYDGAARDGRTVRLAALPASGQRSTLYHAKGCPQCREPGYTAAFRIMEVLAMTDPLRTLVCSTRTRTISRPRRAKEACVTMYEDGLRKAAMGVTTIEEVLRATRED